MAGPVIGRGAELAIAQRFLDSLADDWAALIIEGVAGAGKTTIWQQVIARTAAVGYRALVARPTEPEAGLSYSALSDLLLPVFDALSAQLPAPQASALGAALLRSANAGPVDPRAVAMGLVSALETLAPTVVAVDDVQWLDAASGRALRFAARRLPRRVGLCVVWRSDGSAVAPLGLDGAIDDERITRIVAGPLSVAALHHVIADRFGRPLPRRLLVRVATATGGNPLFALEVAGGLLRTPDAEVRGEPLPIPASVQVVLAARLSSLSASARTVLLVAAMLPRPTVELVARVLDEAINLDTALIEAEEAGVLVARQARLRFTHPLLASIVTASTSETRRRQLHRKLATVTDDPEERALHLASSTTGHDAAIAAEIERGARHASTHGAHDSAVELYDAAANVTPAALGDDRARRLAGQAAALNALGDFADAALLAEHATDLATTAAPRVAALSLLATLAWFRGAASTARQHLLDALAAAGNDPQLTGPVHAKLVRFSLTYDVNDAVAHAEAALSVLDPDRDPLLVAHVILDRFFAAAHRGDPPSTSELARGLALEAGTLTTALEPPHPYPLIWFHSTDAFDVGRARHQLEDDWYGQRGEELWRADRRAHLAVLELRAGRWRLADELARSACEVMAQVEAGGPFAMVAEKRALIDAHHGRFEEARASLVPLIERFEAADQPWWAALSLSTLAITEFFAGHHAAGDDAVARMRQHARTVGATEIPTDRSEPLHVEALLALGECDRARDVLRGLEARGRRLPRPWIDIGLARARALIQADAGNVRGALDELARVEPLSWAHLPFERGLALLVKGRLLRRDRQKRAAADAFAEAIRAFEALAAPIWAERAHAELDRVGLRPAAPSELTESERSVAELAATGLTNREVATQLYMSPKTVEATLGRAYRKLGIRSRAELGGWLRRPGRATTNRGERPIPS